jgi:hypothetical protein
MRSIGRALPAISAAPSAEALRAAATHLRTAASLAPSSSTGIAKGLYRFKTLADAQAHADAALARVMAECESDRERERQRQRKAAR